MKKNNRKGFTIVELVIVIAVIAILAAVLIPTFASVIKKANLSADQQAVATMNKQLAIVDVDEDIDSLPDAITALADAGLDLEDYKPLTKDHYFYFAIINETPMVLLADKNDDVVFPEDAKGSDTAKWFSLSGQAPIDTSFKAVDGVATVNNGAQLANVIQNAKDKKDTVSNVTLNADVNLRGAGVDFGKVNYDLTIDGNDKTLAGVRADDNVVTPTGGEFAGHTYGFGFIPSIEAGTTVTIENITLDGFFAGNTAGTREEGANTTGLIAGYVKGTLILENVTIKNSTVYGFQKVAAIAGQLIGNGSITLKNVKFENVTVIGNTEVAKISGIMNSTASITLDNTTTDGITVESTAEGQFKGSEITPNSDLTAKLGTLTFSADSNYFINSTWIAGAVTNDLAWYAPAAYVKGSELYNLMYNGKNATYNGTAYEFSSYPFTYTA